MRPFHLKELISGYESNRKLRAGTRAAGMTERSFYAKKISGMIGSRRKAAWKSTPAFQNFHRALQSLVYISCRSLGMYLLFYGLTTLLLHFARYYLMQASDVLFSFLLGTGLVLAALPLLLSGRPLCIVLQENSVTDTVFFEFFCLKRMHKGESVPSLPSAISALLGTLVALFGFFVSLPLSLLLPPALLFFFLSLSAPEFPFFVTLILLPYLPLLPQDTPILAALVGCVLLSFVRKVIRGNRVFYFEQYDLVLTLLALCLAISGILRGLDGMRTAAYFVLFLLGYTFAGNLLANRRLVDGIFRALIFASVPISLFAVLQYALGITEYHCFGRAHIGLSDGCATATFSAPTLLAAYLLAVIFLTVSFAADRQRPLHTRRLCLFLTALHIAALLFTGERGAWLAALLALAAYAFLRLGRRAGLSLTLLLLLPCAGLLLPISFSESLLTLLRLPPEIAALRRSVLVSSLSLLSDRLFFGVGLGGSAYQDALPFYAPEGVTAAVTGNLFLQLACEAGALALLFFLLLLLIRARHLSAYARYLSSASVGKQAIAVTVAVFSLLAFGMTSVFLTDPTVFYLFFVLLGIGSATLRLSKQDRDDRLTYYGDDRDPDASVADILISDRFS